jgi:hypothetical protein
MIGSHCTEENCQLNRKRYGNTPKMSTESSSSTSNRSDPFRRIFLDQVEHTIKEVPSRETLLALLRLATPGLESLGNSSETKKLFKALLLRVHPDKHPNDVQRATRLCQDVTPFFKACLESVVAPPNEKNDIRKSFSRQRSENSTAYPLEFNAVDKWPHMQFKKPFIIPDMPADAMSCAVAYQCINARGAIAHGKKPQLAYNNDAVNKLSNVRNAVRGVTFVFSNDGFGGSKELSDVKKIKEEIMNRGPVVSTSFCPSDAFLNSNTIGRSCHRHQSDILIVGWKQLTTGEVWIVQPLYRDGSTTQPVHVAIGQFGIDDCCLAPNGDLENLPWQSGPYYDMSMAGIENVWQTCPAIECHPSSVDSLFKAIGTTNISMSNTIVTVRDKNKKAKSRKATLRKIAWDADKQWFDVKFDFIE